MKTTLILLAGAFLVLSAPTAEASAKVKPYRSNMCAVTDNKLGSMGRVVTIVHEGQEVKFCCRPCVRKFQKNPQKYLKGL